MTSEHSIWESNALLTYGLPIGTILFLLLTGFLTLRKRVVETHLDQNFADDFREKFIEYANSRGENQEAYTFLLLNSARMQQNMGHYGIYSSFIPRASNYSISNYQIIMNMIPELRRWIDSNRESMGTMFVSTIDSYIKNIDEALLRYIGVLAERETKAYKAIKNPFLWLRTGAGQVLSLPLILLVLFGLMTKSTLRSLQANYIFRALSALAVIITLVSGAMTILLGWEQTIEIAGQFSTNWLQEEIK